jgi:hypothetical protein
VHTCNLRTQEAETGGSQVLGQSWLHKETLSKKYLIRGRNLASEYQVARREGGTGEGRAQCY